MSLTPAQIKEYKELAIERKAERDAAEKERLANDQLRLELRRESDAAEKEAKLKGQAQRAWIAEGGSIAAFEKQWDSMHEQIIAARVIEHLRDPAKTRARLGHTPRGLG